jgi:hypothetical protein
MEVLAIMYNDPNTPPPYGQPSGPYQQPPYGDPSQYQQPYGVPPPYQQPPYGAQQPYQQPLPPKSSNRGVWIGCGIALVVFLLIGGICSGVVYFGYLKGTQVFNSAINQFDATATVIQSTAIADEPSPQQQAEAYYQDIEAQDYTNAYTYTAPGITGANGQILTEATFNQEAHKLDSSEGAVSNFTVNVDPNDSTKVSVQVTRQNGKSYTVQLTFQQNNSGWVISSFTNI